MESQKKRGRPRLVESREVVWVALQLFERDGFEKVTMEEVAKQASVSRRTLFRLFPSKADLLWEGAAEVLSTLKEHAKVLCLGQMTLRSLVHGLALPVLERLEQPKIGALARRRLRLIMASPALLDHPTLEEIRSFFTELIRTHVHPSQTPPELLGYSIVSVAFASLLWWAQFDESPMLAKEAFLSACGALSELSSHPSGA